MPATDTAARRRIEIAKARLDTWTDHQRTLGLDPADLEDLASCIREAEGALWKAEALAHAGPADEFYLKAALEDLRIVIELMGRGIAGRARVGGARRVRTAAGRRARLDQRPEIKSLAQKADGSVELAIECANLGRDSKLYVEVRRRAGPRGEYRAIGTTRRGKFVDPAPHEGGAVAAYKVVPRRGRHIGPHSERVQVELDGSPVRHGAAIRQDGLAAAAA